MYIIQTNTSLNDNYDPRDFQSMMYKISKQTWEEFKEYILSNEEYTEKLVSGTMMRSTKPRNFTIEKVLINDNRHLEVIMRYGFSNQLLVNSKYQMVTDEQFQGLL